MKAWLTIALMLVLPQVASAEDLTLFTVTDGETTQDYSMKLKILFFMTFLTVMPILVLLCTPFTRILIVLGILRQALGLQQSPPNKVLVGIALCLTMLIMRPEFTEIYEKAYLPYEAGEITTQEGIDIAEDPIREFMFRQTNEKALEQMLLIADEPLTLEKDDVPFSVLMPAFVLSELKTALQIGFMLFIPFLVIDLIVASVLMAMGMMMLSPLIISLPFKLMIFVLVDGWALTVGTLTRSFG